MCMHSHRTSLRVFLFAEHKLADLWVHLGMAWRNPHRIDHWLELVVHFRKYCGHPVAFLNRPVALINNAMPLDDCIDCFAHCYTGLVVLGPLRFAAWVLFAATLRVAMSIDHRMHRRQREPKTA